MGGLSLSCRPCEWSEGRIGRSRCRALEIQQHPRCLPPAMTVSAPALAPPDLNQLVRVRGRHWVVSDVRRSTLKHDPLAVHDRLQHLVELSSVEDDGLGETLSVVWEIEPGARVLASETFPIPRRGHFDEPERLSAFLDAVR